MFQSIFEGSLRICIQGEFGDLYSGLRGFGREAPEMEY